MRKRGTDFEESCYELTILAPQPPKVFLLLKRRDMKTPKNNLTPFCWFFWKPLYCLRISDRQCNFSDFKIFIRSVFCLKRDRLPNRAILLRCLHLVLK